MGTDHTVLISIDPMTIDELIAVADGTRMEVSGDLRERLAESRRVVDDAIARGEAVYGVTTGVGHARDERLPLEALREFQPMLVEMHMGGLGDPLPTERVRAGMAARLNGLARGGAGVSLPVVEGLTGLLNHRIHPHVPEGGSVGTGDLGQLAYVARALLGRGEVEWDGRRMDASEALGAVGLEPVPMEPKDALAVMSSNALSIGHGALLVRRLRHALATADLVAATSMEATFANPSVVDPVVASARGSRGQVVSSERIRSARHGSTRLEAEAISVQDPLSFRVVPQVHGACLDALEHLDDTLGSELNAPSDNPLVDPASGRILSNGNFCAMNLALAAEGMRVALCHVGLAAERRMGQMWDRAVGSMSAAGAAAGPPPGPAAPALLAGLGLRYPAAARYARLRHLAQPITLDIGSLDLGVEDHAPNTAAALELVDEMIGILEELLTIESMIGLALLAAAAADGLGRGTGRLVTALLAEVEKVPAGSEPQEVFARLRDVVSRQVISDPPL